LPQNIERQPRHIAELQPPISRQATQDRPDNILAWLTHINERQMQVTRANERV